MTNKLLNVYDNVFTAEEHKNVINYCRDCSYTYGERDLPDTPPCGMVHEIPQEENIYKLMSSKIENDLYPDVKELSLFRMYINCFSPADEPYFHTDGPNGGLTFIYYANDEEWNINDGGETQFYIDSKGVRMLTGVPPIPNRMAMFGASQLHCATSFRNRYKFTLAIKYQAVPSYDEIKEEVQKIKEGKTEQWQT